MRKCYFCGEDAKEALHEHHIVPQGFGDYNETVTLCATCHRKLHHLNDRLFCIVLEKYVKEIDEKFQKLVTKM